jgi:hypothetical protein
VKRLESGRPRRRLTEGADPTGPINDLYRGKSNVRITRAGELKSDKPSVSPKRWADENQQPQFHEDQHDSNYDNDTGRSWEHSGGDRRPNFDHKAGSGHHFREPPSGGQRNATGKDCMKSPWSVAYRKGAGENF